MTNAEALQPFGNVPFLMGSVHGEKSWQITRSPQGRLLLQSPQFPMLWETGEQEAECRVTRNRWDIRQLERAVNRYCDSIHCTLLDGEINMDANGWQNQWQMRLQIRFGQGVTLPRDFVGNWTTGAKDQIEATTMFDLDEFMKQWGDSEANVHNLADCMCGFYAYLTGHNEYHTDDRATGIIEGWGEVLIGTKGFRATKARVVALWAGTFAERDGLRQSYPGVPIFDSLTNMRAAYPTTRIEEFG